MVAFQPDFKEIFKLAVARDVVRRQMAMVIEDRLFFGVMVIKPLRGFRAQQKMVVNEGHGFLRCKSLISAVILYKWLNRLCALRSIAVTHKQRLKMPFVKVFRDVLRHELFVLLERVQITVAHLRGHFIAHMQQLAQMRVIGGVFRIMAQRRRQIVRKSSR